MHLAIIAAVFPVIFIGELPDKTMFASLVMATRGNPLSVWLGAAGAFVIHVVIATTVGVVLFRLLPHRALDAIVAVMFLVGAGLAIREARRAQREESLVEREVESGRRTVTTALVVVFLAEWGDLTQILTANLAAHYHSPLSVGIGAVLALWAVAALAVVGGQSVLRVVNIRTVRSVTAVILFGACGMGRMASDQVARDPLRVNAAARAVDVLSTSLPRVRRPLDSADGGHHRLDVSPLSCVSLHSIKHAD